MSTVDHPQAARQGRIFRVESGGVPVTAAVAGVVELDDEPYADSTLSDRQLLAHAASELMRARQAGISVLGILAGPSPRIRSARHTLRGAA